MKTYILAFLLAIPIALGGCAGTGTIHKPTTVSNAVGAAYIAYGSAGYYASKYFGLTPCATPPVYPCKVKSVNDSLLKIDTAAWTAAHAADAAGATQVQKDNAREKLEELKRANADPEVTKQLALLPKETTP